MDVKAIAEAAKSLDYAADVTMKTCDAIFRDHETDIHSPEGRLAVTMMAFATAIALFAERVQKAAEEPTA
jgi:hypothetical protein